MRLKVANFSETPGKFFETQFAKDQAQHVSELMWKRTRTKARTSEREE